MEKILFVHMNQLGDLLFSLPILAGARKSLKNISIFSLVRPDLIPLIESTGFVDGVISRSKKNIFDKLSLIDKIRHELFSKAIIFSESPASLILCSVCKIPQRVGFSTSSLSFLLTTKIERYGVPSLENNKRLAQACGISDIPQDYSGLINIPSFVLDSCIKWFKDNNIDYNRIVSIAPGASKRRRDKFWVKERWIDIIDYLYQIGYHPIIVGARWEKELLEKIANNSARIFIPENLIMLAAIFKISRLFIGIDSGAMHLAASVGTPVIALFGPTDPSQIGPLPRDKHIILKRKDMIDIKTEDVCNSIDKVLTR